MTTTIHPCEAADNRKSTSSMSSIQLPDSFTLVIFGATGDLAARKLMPALANLWRDGFLPKSYAIVGVGRREVADQSFRNDVNQAIAVLQQGPSTSNTDEFLSRIFYCSADVSSGSVDTLGRRLNDLELQMQLPGNRLFYLAIDPELFGPTVAGLANT